LAAREVRLGQSGGLDQNCGPGAFNVGFFGQVEGPGRQRIYNIQLGSKRATMIGNFLLKTKVLSAQPLSVSLIRKAIGTSLPKTFRAFALSLGIAAALQAPATAEILSPPNINGSNTVGTQNLAGTAVGSITTGVLSGLA
jgi:hypothetical protein